MCRQNACVAYNGNIVCDIQNIKGETGWIIASLRPRLSLRIGVKLGEDKFVTHIT